MGGTVKKENSIATKERDNPNLFHFGVPKNRVILPSGVTQIQRLDHSNKNLHTPYHTVFLIARLKASRETVFQKNNTFFASFYDFLFSRMNSL